MDGRRVRGPRRERVEGSAAGARRDAKSARRRKFDVLVCWRLDRLGRNLRHLVTMLDELQGLGVAFVSLGEGIDCTTPAGKLQLHILAALAEFERERIRERVNAGLRRAREQGKRLGRPKARLPIERLQTVAGLPSIWPPIGWVSRSTLKRWRRQVQQSPPRSSLRFRPGLAVNSNRRSGGSTIKCLLSPEVHRDLRRIRRVRKHFAGPCRVHHDLIAWPRRIDGEVDRTCELLVARSSDVDPACDFGVSRRTCQHDDCGANCAQLLRHHRRILSLSDE